MPQSGGVRHSWPGGPAFRSAVGQPRPHVVEQEVRVGPDELPAQLGPLGIDAGHVLRRVAGRASALVEDLLAAQHVRRVDAPAHRDGEVPRVEARRDRTSSARPRRRAAGPPPFGAPRQRVWACVQSPAEPGSSSVDRPMSPLNAPAVWSRIVARAAFQPNRPSIGRPCSMLHTWFGRPEMPSPSRSSGSARARMSASSTISSRPRPIIGGGDAGGEQTSGRIGPYPRSVAR